MGTGLHPTSLRDWSGGGDCGTSGACGTNDARCRLAPALVVLARQPSSRFGGHLGPACLVSRAQRMGCQSISLAAQISQQRRGSHPDENVIHPTPSHLNQKARSFRSRWGFQADTMWPRSVPQLPTTAPITWVTTRAESLLYPSSSTMFRCMNLLACAPGVAILLPSWIPRLSRVKLCVPNLRCQPHRSHHNRSFDIKRNARAQGVVFLVDERRPNCTTNSETRVRIN
jgi:hypothetical protein